MTNRLTDLDAYTNEELEQALARVLVHAQGEVLNDAEVERPSPFCSGNCRNQAISLRAGQ